MEPRPTILLVQTAPDERGMYAAFLATQGFLPRAVGDTADALISACHADVIVTGLRVPGPFDGLELVRRVRHLSDTIRKVIIVLTGCAYEADQQHAFAAGCDVFLTKPCLPDVLAREIRRLLPSTTRTAEVRTAVKSDRRQSSARKTYEDAARHLSELFCAAGEAHERVGNHSERGLIMRTAHSILQRVRAEYLEMPGMSLTSEQIERLCGIERSLASAVLKVLVEEKFLGVKSDGRYGRLIDGERARPRAAKAALPPTVPVGELRQGAVSRAETGTRG